MGDLRVRKVYPNSVTIHIDCGSNKKEQIDLISKLFKPYGRVWIKEIPTRGGYFQIECSVNLSFDFLLKKRVLADKWILENKNYFAAFLLDLLMQKDVYQSLSKIEPSMLLGTIIIDFWHRFVKN